MRIVPDVLKDHIASGATTICRAWRVTRQDGTVLGFTEHDAALTFAGTDFAAASGFQASDAEETIGLSPESGDVAGAFSSEAITEPDLIKGLYDGARVEIFAVNWAEPEQYLLEHVREIGEVTRTQAHFQAELRGLAARLDQRTGRVYGRRCDAALGDSRCRVNLPSPAYASSGHVIAADRMQATVSGLSGFADGFFRFGVLTFTSGAMSGLKLDIGSHKAGAEALLTFWLPLTLAPETGDAFVISAGCDKAYATCRAKFSNAANFQGFPHMPGSDFAYSYVSGASTHNGSPLYR
jgi:uncharacterized phage protein (TIGR02218 family)